MSRENCSLTYKGYGRVYVLDPSQVETVVEIIREIDPHEFEYTPKGIVTPRLCTPPNLNLTLMHL